MRDMIQSSHSLNEQVTNDFPATGPSSTFLALWFLWELLKLEPLLKRHDFASLYDKVRHCPVANGPAFPRVTQRICSAFDLASIWYWKPVLCLQRSAATTFVLRAHGVPAHLVIGAQLTPFKAHAWVEVASQVVNDKPYMREVYSVVDTL